MLEDNYMYLVIEKHMWEDVTVLKKVKTGCGPRHFGW